MAAELSDIIQTMILKSPIPAKILAEQIGKPYSTLLREANPNDSSHIFTFALCRDIGAGVKTYL